MLEGDEGGLARMTIDYKAIRDELAKILSDVPGVMSIGIGKENNKVVLLVAIDPNDFAGNVPSSFQGVGVIIRNLGMASLHSFFRRQGECPSISDS